MYYLSIDIETTGLNPQTCDIIEFAAILDDLSNPQPVDSLPYFHAYIKQECFNGEPYALSMHSKTFEKIAYAQKNNIEIPVGICKGLSEEDFDKMINVSLGMKPLWENALGKDWEKIMTREKLRILYDKL